MKCNRLSRIPLPLRQIIILVPQLIHPSVFNVREIYKISQPATTKVKKHLSLGLALNLMTVSLHSLAAPEKEGRVPVDIEMYAVQAQLRLIVRYVRGDVPPLGKTGPPTPIEGFLRQGRDLFHIKDSAMHRARGRYSSTRKRVGTIAQVLLEIQASSVWDIARSDQSEPYTIATFPADGG